MAMGEKMNQIKKPLWEEHLKYPGIPFVGVTAEINNRDTDRTYYFLTIPCCPYCGEQHHHGGAVLSGGKLRPGYDFGHRVEHCADRWVNGHFVSKKIENGYFLVYVGGK
jgi:hypothetical protein